MNRRRGASDSSTTRRQRATSEEEETKPSQRRRSAHSEEEDDAPRSRRRGSASDNSESKEKLSGWEKLSRRREQMEAERGSDTRDFWLKDGEYAFIQLLHDEPHVYDSYSIKNSKGQWIDAVSQREMQDHCLLEQAGLKSSPKAGWLILDFRGSWDKDKKEFKWDEPTLKVLKASLKLAQQIQAKKDRSKKPLTELVFDIQRTGTGTSTSYSLATAFDEETDSPVKPRKYKGKLPDITEVIKPFTDEQLIAMGFGSDGGDYDHDY